MRFPWFVFINNYKFNEHHIKSNCIYINLISDIYTNTPFYTFEGSLNDLRLWSGDIGSDITFFFTSGTAYCTGRGEIVDSKSKLPQADETIVHIFKPRYYFIYFLLLSIY